MFKDLDTEAATLGPEALGSGRFSLLPMGRWADYRTLVSSAPNLGQSVVIPSRSKALGPVLDVRTPRPLQVERPVLSAVSGQSPKSRLRMEQADLSLNPVVQLTVCDFGHITSFRVSEPGLSPM